MSWSSEEHEELIKLRDEGLTYNDIARKLEEQYKRPFTYNSVRNRLRRTKAMVPNKALEYKETVEIKSDGSQFSDKLIELSDAEMKDPAYVMKAHGYDPNEWEMINVKSSVWHHLNKMMTNPKMLYASKITVKPKTNTFDYDKLIESIKNVPKYHIEQIINNSKTYLNINHADMHFGIVGIEFYKPTQQRTIHLIRKGHKEILFILGNDLFHVDNFRNTTASGREIQQIDFVKAWEDAKQYYYPLLEQSLESSEHTKVIYTKGNHSESMEWAFVQMLKERYPQIEFDDSLKERKVHMLGLNFIGSNHGDKKSINKLTENFAVEFPHEWSRAKTRTVFTGHLHHEKVIDKGGLLLRQLSTGVDPDRWHDDMGYTTAHKRFQVHEYEYDSEKCIYYV